MKTELYVNDELVEMEFLNENNDVLDYWNIPDIQGIYVIKVNLGHKDGIYVGKSFVSIKTRINVHNGKVKKKIFKGGYANKFYTESAKGLKMEVIDVIPTHYWGEYGKYLLHEDEKALIAEYEANGHYMLNDPEGQKKIFKSKNLNYQEERR